MRPVPILVTQMLRLGNLFGVLPSCPEAGRSPLLQCLMPSVVVVLFAKAVEVVLPIRNEADTRSRPQHAMQPFVPTVLAACRAGFCRESEKLLLPHFLGPSRFRSKGFILCSGREQDVSLLAHGGVRRLPRTDWHEACGQLLSAQLVLAHQQAFKGCDSLVNRLLLVLKITEDLIQIEIQLIKLLSEWLNYVLLTETTL